MNRRQQRKQREKRTDLPPLFSVTSYSLDSAGKKDSRPFHQMDEPRLLILETSGRTGEVALARGPVIVQHRLLDQTRLHARDLAPAVASILSAEGCKPAEVQGLIINRGPGSYTGLRVGIMSAKTFAYATGCALVAVDAFAAVVRQAPAEILQIVVIADAQQDRIYHQNFSRSSPDMEISPASPLQIDRFSDWLEGLANKSWVTGPGLRTLRSQLPAYIRVPEEVCWDPHPKALLDIGLPRFAGGERDDYWTLEPLYLRPSSAEEKWARTKRAQGEASIKPSESPDRSEPRPG
jgi:tRNA threonylcarbamoyladenosine biosynthesis protein TsaB